MTEQHIVNLNAYGVQPDTDSDITSALCKALADIREYPAARLILPRGKFRIHSEGPASGERFNPVFILDGYHALTIEGHETELIVTDTVPLFAFFNCHDIILRNFSIDYDPLPFSGGRVIATGPGWFDLKVMTPNIARGGVRVEGSLEYDPVHMRLARQEVDYYQIGYPKRSELVAPDTMRIYLQYPEQLPRLESCALVRFQIYACNAFTLSRCTNVEFDHIDIYTCPGMGIYADSCRDISLSSFNTILRPGAGRWMTVTADSTHFNNCRGAIVMEDCLFEAMGDDAGNFHNMYTTIAQRIDERTLALALGRRRSGLPPAMEAGDQLEFGCNPNPLVPYATAVVESWDLDSAKQLAYVHLVDKLPDQAQVGDVIANASTCAATVIRRCTVRNNRARGLLIQTRNVLIEECTFAYNSAAALHITADATYWYEGMGTRDVTVRNCTFIGGNYGTASRHGLLDIFAEVGGELAGPGVHRNILIDNCTFGEITGAAIHVCSANGVRITNNHISGFLETPPAFCFPGHEGAPVRSEVPVDSIGVGVLIEHSCKVSVTNNEMTGGKAGVRTGPDVDLATISATGNVGF